MPSKIPTPSRKPPAPENFFATLLNGYSDEDMRDFFKEHERPVEHIYRDSENYPTVGVGHLLSDVRKALELPFIYSPAGNEAIERPATAAEIRNAYDKLPSQPVKGRGAYKAGWFEPHKRGLEPVFLPPSEIDQLLDQDIRQHVKELQTKFRGFGDYPAPVRKALLDMQFNMGGRFTPQRWPKFYGAVDAEDWEAAARESNRRQVDSGRNKQVYELFREAVEEQE